MIKSHTFGQCTAPSTPTSLPAEVSSGLPRIPPPPALTSAAPSTAVQRQSTPPPPPIIIITSAVPNTAVRRRPGSGIWPRGQSTTSEASPESSGWHERSAEDDQGLVKATGNMVQPPPPRRVGGRESNHSQPTHPIHTSHTYSYLSGRWPVGRHLHHLQAVQFKELGSGRRRGTAHAGQLAVEAKKYLRVLPQGAGVWSSCLLNPNYRVYRVITPTSGHFITVILLGRASLRPMTRWPPSPSSPLLLLPSFLPTPPPLPGR